MLAIKFTNKMKRDVKRMAKRGKDIVKLTIVLDLIASKEQMPEKYRDHSLKGDMQGYRECHIEPDWLLVYQINNDELILLASRHGNSLRPL